MHEEKNDWLSLKALVTSKGNSSKGIGIPFGGGVIYHPDNTLKPIRNSIYEILLDVEDGNSIITY